ncbi:type 2 lanthipeptide synthetase LanM family protein [Ktedonospora formicarum]|uniref:Lantibiotic biosynthesis protein dehydration domain-containing protein n=1 Tax=Ktedonospora formicarum TaxID=2778364 RepID=A0A8J3I9R9_9CHLR|nr:type 2 lanthipeptide synthetase LanM family protein [Ktedonospora formicarum]GHO48363.1 hypothetical protein KSX_65260 [Ktedonospora formicarum]
MKKQCGRKNQALWQTPAWYTALSLTERCVRGQGRPQDTLTEEHLDKATQRLNAWKAQSPFDHGTFFADRLTSDSLTEEDLLAFLAESAAEIKARTPSVPDWLNALIEAFSEADDGDQILPVSQEILKNHPLGPYMQTINPLLLSGFTSLQKGIQKLQQRYAFLPFDEKQVSERFLKNIIPQLLFQIGKTMVLEMHVARVQGHLQGETPEERFMDFIRQLCQEEKIVTLFAEYPVLARLLITTINRWTHYAIEILDHLCADWSDICRVFTPGGDPGLLVDMQGGVGDLHRGGRSVHILRFSSGLQLLYKPKPLAIDKHFQELLAWLNEHGAQPPFRVLKLLARGDYGWSEFVEAVACTSQAEIVRFYERQGEYLALLYTLNATDLHIENVIASGEHPMPVDLETLLLPRLAESDATPRIDFAARLMNQSVLEVGLLPQWTWASENSPGVDLSGLGGQAGQIMPHPLPAWDEIRTEQMHLTLRQAEMWTGQNRPQLNGQDVNVLDYRSDIITGFTRMYRLLMNVREAFLTEQLPRFAHDEIRILLRSTHFYTLLLAASFHPDLLRDGLERDRFFDRLWQGVEQWSDLSKVIPAERRELLEGDIPLFTTFPDSHTLFSSDREPLFDLFDTTGLDQMRKRIEHLNEQDLAQQVWIIATSLAVPQMGFEGLVEKSLSLHPIHQPATRERMIALAKTIGARLEDLALQEDEMVSWLGVNLFREKAWGLFPAGTDLYDGIGGITLFLAYLGAVTSEARFTSLAKRALTTVRAQVAALCEQIDGQKDDSFNMGVGVFEGWSSSLYLLTHLSVLWNEPALIREAEKLLEYLPALIAKDEHPDILTGSAGCILSLLSLYAVHSSPRVLEIALQCGDHLRAIAQAMPVGTGWVIDKEEQPLGGFSHGSTGIAMSLLKLAGVSGEERFRQTALSALAYDRSLFLPAQQNWADVRKPTSKTRQSDTMATGPLQKCMVAWCHGASGIGLGRLGALEYMDDEQVREEIDIALNTTMTQGLDSNHSLCHGSLGNAELLLTAARLLNRQEDHERLEQAIATILGSIDAEAWVTGVPLGVEVPGLMTGLAGMGYELLRLAEPEKVPSVLLVAPPVVQDKE